MPTKFVLKRKCDEIGAICKHKSSLVLCDNEEWEKWAMFLPSLIPYCDEGVFLSGISKQMEKKHFDFQNGFPNRNLKRKVYGELTKYIYSE